MNDDLISRQAALEIKVSDGYNVDGILYVPFKDVECYHLSRVVKRPKM